MSVGFDSREPHERFEPRVDRAPIALARDPGAPGLARHRPAREQGLERRNEVVDGLVHAAALRARDLSRGDRVPGGDEDGRALLPRLEQHDAEALEVRRQDERVGGGERLPLLVVADAAERDDVVADRERHAHGAREDERRVEQCGARGPGVDQLVAGLRLRDLAEIEDERTAGADAAAQHLAVHVGGRIEADTEDDVRDVLVPEAALHEVALLWREEAERTREREEPAVRRECQRQLVVRGRDEDRALRHDRQAECRGLVDVGPEEDRVVRLTLLVEELEERRRVRSLSARPVELVREGVLLEEDAPFDRLELRIAAARDREAAHRHAAHRVIPRAVMLGPGPVVECGRRRDLDLMAAGKPLDHRARVALRAPDDLLTVPLHDREQLQRCTRAGFRP